MKSKTSKICHKCGREIPKDAEKCKFCGAVWQNWLKRDKVNVIATTVNLFLLGFVLLQIHQANVQIQQNRNAISKTDTLISTLKSNVEALNSHIATVKNEVTTMKEAEDRREKRFSEENKPVINVKITKATVDKDTLWVFMDISNEGKQNAGDLSLTSSFLEAEEGGISIVSVSAETTDILAGHTSNNKYPYFSKSKIYPAEFTIVTKIIWKWRGYNMIYGDTVAYTLKRSSENATQWNAYREPKKSAVEASKALEKIQR